jgi:hypothetical protein
MSRKRQLPRWIADFCNKFAGSDLEKLPGDQSRIERLMRLQALKDVRAGPPATRSG